MGGPALFANRSAMSAFPDVTRSYSDRRRGLSERLHVLELSGTPTVGVIAGPEGRRCAFGSAGATRAIAPVRTLDDCLGNALPRLRMDH